MADDDPYTVIGLPPHSRGWTLDWSVQGGAPEVAGRRVFVAGATRFPRTRGDGPLLAW